MEGGIIVGESHEQVYNSKNGEDADLCETEGKFPSYVVKVFKGLNDAVNNGVYETFRLHKQNQDFDCPIK